jgi:hypothetical protein
MEETETVEDLDRILRAGALYSARLWTSPMDNGRLNIQVCLYGGSILDLTVQQADPVAPAFAKIKDKFVDYLKEHGTNVSSAPKDFSPEQRAALRDAALNILTS